MQVGFGPMGLFLGLPNIILYTQIFTHKTHTHTHTHTLAKETEEMKGPGERSAEIAVYNLYYKERKLLSKSTSIEIVSTRFIHQFMGNLHAYITTKETGNK